MKHRLCILFTLLLFFAHSTTICGAQYDDDTDATLAPYFLIDGMDTATDSFPLKETNVSVNINGIFAETDKRHLCLSGFLQSNHPWHENGNRG